MPGIGTVLNIAKDALAAQQYGIQVTGHNIANVDTPGFSRQRVVYAANEPTPFGGLLFGSGVDTQSVMRVADQFIENQLIQKKSNLSAYSEMENYMQVLESLFNENSDNSISNLMADFWNSWHDIANNPSGTAERVALYERSVLFSDHFNTFDSNLAQLRTDLTNALDAGVGKINQLTEQIAQLNDQIVGLEAGGAMANDLRDTRNTLVSELSEYVDVKTFEQSDSSTTIVTVLGCVLVSGNSNYGLEMNGSAVEWQDSSGSTTDITGYISNGKMGGWLDMRDEVLQKYQLDLDALTEKFIWSVNQQHSEGVGVQLIQPGNSLTGTYLTSTTLGDLAYGSAADSYVDYSGTFNFWIGDSQGENLQSVAIDMDSVLGDIEAVSSLADLRDSINAQLAAQLPGLGLPADAVQASLSTAGDAIVFTAGANSTFGFADDASNILAALGINTFFEGHGAGSIGVNALLRNEDYIAAGIIDATGNYAEGDNTNALAILDLQFSSMNISQWTCDRVAGNTEGTATATLENYYHTLAGSIGIKSDSITRNRTFNEVMVSQIGTIRDGISAVSLDEEMTNLIAFQHGYTAAAKLISISDEMLLSVLNTK